MISRWLKEITDIPGVEGVLLVSMNGKIIEKIGTQFDRSILEKISSHILRIISAYNLDKKVVKDIEVIWYDYQILAVSSKDFIIIIFCGSMKALSLLRITLNVVVAHLLEDKKSMKQIKKFTVDKKSVLDSTELEELEINLISKLQ